MKTIEEITKEAKYVYSASGLVHGKYWGSGEGSYPAVRITSNVSIDDLREHIKKKLNDGSLDSGMGYKSLIGAIMCIETITILSIDDKEYVNKESEVEFFGDLNEKQQDFLEETYYQT